MPSVDEITGALANLQPAADTFTWQVLLRTALLWVGCFLVARLLLRFFNRALSRSKVDPSLHSFLRSGVKIGLYFVVAIILADSVNIQVTSLVAVLSVFGLALSLAVQDSLANLASGIILLTTKPFAVGDFVETDGVNGTVQEIGLVYTVLITPDGKTVYLPNGSISKGQIINYTTAGRRRVEVLIGASYDAPTSLVLEALALAVKGTSQLLADPAPFMALKDYGDSAIQYVVRAWAPADKFTDAEFGLKTQIRIAFEEKGVEIPYNHLNVHILNP